MVVQQSQCGSSPNTSHLFVIEDACSLGHMQMSFIQLFSWMLHVALEGSTVAYTIFEARCGELQQIKDKYYLPMLGGFMNYSESELGLQLKLLDTNSPDELMSCRNRWLPNNTSVQLSRRGCSRGNWIGHCSAWFPNTPGVVQWQKFLHKTVLSTMKDVSFTAQAAKLRVLVFDRAKGYKRTLLDPTEVENVTSANCNESSVTYYQFAGKREDAAPWEWNCRYFSQFNVIVIVHGAAVSNIVCTPPGSGLVEIGPALTGGKVSMYMSLVQQLGIMYKFVPFARGRDNFSGIVQPDVNLLGSAVNSICESMKSDRG